MTPMDIPLGASGPRPDVELICLERGLQRAKESGTPLTEEQHTKIQELFKKYSTYSEPARKTKFTKYPLLVEQFQKLIKQKLP